MTYFKEIGYKYKDFYYDNKSISTKSIRKDDFVL
jgi:hypothetical protein